MQKVLIVNMPFANLRWPNLGPSLLKSALQERGIPCDIAYFNFDFAEFIGYDVYTWIADNFAFVLGGERLFAKWYFGDQLPDDQTYFEEVLLAADPELSSQELRDFERLYSVIPKFLERCWHAIDWPQYSVVGFAVSFQQSLASLCLARKIKEHFPGTTVVFGGAACEGEMGVALWEQFPEIDFVFLGEADFTFAPLVEQIFQGTLTHLPPGVVGLFQPGQTCSAKERIGKGRWLAGSSGAKTIDLSVVPSPGPTEAPFVVDLDSLPVPNFDDYFARLNGSDLRPWIDPLIFFETSRGCWWGEKHHCNFCGLNGSRLVYRSKSAPRAVAELTTLAKRYNVRKASAADNIFDFRYFKSFLPLFREQHLDLKLVYELKCNLTREQIRELVSSGLGAAQLGIETFVTRVLKSINKGATGLQNLQTLKWFSAYPIEVEWNFLYGFPEENPKDYRWLETLLPKLVHLAPPLAIGRVRMDRFSPYFENPERYGLTRRRPHRAFRFVFPFPPSVLAQLAYYFEFDYQDARNPADYAARALRAATAWQEQKGLASLRQYDRGDGTLILTDTRPIATAFQHRLYGWERDLYLFCDVGRSWSTIGRQFLAQRRDLNEKAVKETLDRWITSGLMVWIDEHYFSLAINPPEQVLADDTTPRGV